MRVFRLGLGVSDRAPSRRRTRDPQCRSIVGFFTVSPRAREPYAGAVRAHGTTEAGTCATAASSLFRTCV